MCLDALNRFCLEIAKGTPPEFLAQASLSSYISPDSNNGAKMRERSSELNPKSQVKTAEVLCGYSVVE